MDAIVVNNVSKRFRIPHEKKTTLFHNLVGIIKRQFTYEEFWALKDVSFTVQKGETFGIIGNNGSGKSTLLKMLAKVLYPDTGTITTNGKIAPFLELGVGFQPELTAKENVFIYSSVLGVSRREVDKNYDAIFDFAELRKFENMKLKNFSSGMYTRLAFSTAINASPETLLIDEVLSVGDEAFQKKCAAKIDELRSQGKTIVFVSHALDTVLSLCQRSLLLNHGHMVSMGGTREVIEEYRARVNGGINDV
jgi:lipopolysaccharide transport system ATP-binding protein